MVTIYKPNLDTMYLLMRRETICSFRFCIMVITFSLTSSAFAQTILVKGTVLNERGTPLSGVNVRCKEGDCITQTNTEGKFSLNVGRGKVLEFSLVGYQQQEKSIVSGAELTIVLESITEKLQEVVVVGYGTVRKIDLTGAVTQLDMKDLSKAPISTFEEGLAGRLAGVQVQSSDGQPGNEMNIVIRGANSLTQDNSPLYVIDGFPVENPDQNAINPDDIESINVLKDASSTAIYGARGANGVIVIETKKGKVGKPTINFSTSFGTQNVRKTIPVMSPYEFVKYQLEYNPNAEFLYMRDGKTLDSYSELEEINWQSHTFRTGSRTINNISIRGGSSNTRYALSGSYHDQAGVIRNSGNKRYQGRLTLDQRINRTLRMGVTANVSNMQAHGQRIADGAGAESSFSTYLLYRVWGYRPISGDSNVNLLEEEFDPDAVSMIDARVNPVISNANEYNQQEILSLFSNGYIHYDITPKLSLRVNGSISNQVNGREIFNNSKTVSGSPALPFNVLGVNGRINEYTTNVFSNENTLTYKTKFDNDHDVTALLGFSAQKRTVKYNSFAAQDVPNEYLGIDGLGQGTPYLIQRDFTQNGLVSYFGRVNYGYLSKYLLTATLRYDGSSKFASNNRWAAFPSVAVAWNMQEESFLKNSPVISNSKIRVSYGVSGNNRVGDFSNRSSFNQTQFSPYSFHNSTPTKSIIPMTVGNADLKWESTFQYNVGYDLGLFKNRLEVTLDVYRKTTRDLLLEAELPKTSGFLRAFKNVGAIRNDGLELAVSTANIKRKDFSWSTNFNISFNRNKVLELTEGKATLLTDNPVFLDGAFNTPLYISQIGQPAGLYYGYVFDGIYQYEDFDQVAPDRYYLKTGIVTNGHDREVIQPGDIKYQDLNGDGVVNDMDMTIIGRGLPVHIGGFTNNFVYKNFDLNIFLQWSYGNDLINANRLVLEGQGGTTRFNINQYASYENRWSPTNPNNDMFRAGGQGPIGRYSTRIIEDGSYLRLKTVSLGYTIGKWKNKFNSLRVFVSGQNLLTFTNYRGMDPEVAVRHSALTPGFDFSAYPQSRTIVFGLNLNL